jgi:hypothetical protein
MRMISVIGAIALASLCLAFPAAAATPDYPASVDVIMLEPAPAFDMFAPVAYQAIEAVAHDADFVLASTIAADEAECPVTSFTLYGGPASGSMTAAILSTTSRRYDPGWCAS